MTIDTADLRDVSLAEAAQIVGINPRTLKGLWCDIPTAWKTPGGQYRVALWGIKDWQLERSKAASPADGFDGPRSSGLPKPSAGGIATSGEVRDAPVTGSGEHGDPAYSTEETLTSASSRKTNR